MHCRDGTVSVHCSLSFLIMVNILYNHGSAPFTSCLPEEASCPEAPAAWVGNTCTEITSASAPAGSAVLLVKLQCTRVPRLQVPGTGVAAQGSGSRGCVLTGQPGGVGALRQIHPWDVPGRLGPATQCIQHLPGAQYLTPQVGKAWRKTQL